MKLNDYILPKNLVEALKDVNPLEEVKKFLVGFDKASQCDYLPHLKDEKLMSFIDIPKEKMLFGEINNLGHSEYDYKVFNPCNDYFMEYLFGSLFELDFIQVNRCKSKLVDDVYLDPGRVVMQVIKKIVIYTKSKNIYIYQLSWSAGQSGDPWYFVLNEDDLDLLVTEVFELNTTLWQDGISNYLAARIAENHYQVNVAHQMIRNPIRTDHEYINNIIESRHLDEYHWWESD